MTREELIQARDELRAQYAAWWDKLYPILQELERLGEEPHDHGAGSWGDPIWSHTHPYDDDDHDHAGTEEEAAAQERVRSDWP